MNRFGPMALLNGANGTSIGTNGDSVSGANGDHLVVNGDRHWQSLVPSRWHRLMHSMVILSLQPPFE